MRKSAKENGIVVATIVLCFMVTLGLCYTFTGSGFLHVFKKTETTSYYAIVTGGYADVNLARSTAEILKQRGGAGYVLLGNVIEIVMSVYPDKNSAESVLGKLEDKNAYLKEIPIANPNYKWCKKENRACVDEAMKYFALAYNRLADLSYDLSENKITINDVKTQLDVLYTQISEIKSSFYQNIISTDADQIVEIKLALVTCQALLNNVTFYNDLQKTTASLRYQQVQLLLCYQALMSKL